MRSPGPEYYPISGRTYSLFGEFFQNSIDLRELERLVRKAS
jgi:hypothetical protein